MCLKLLRAKRAADKETPVNKLLRAKRSAQKERFVEKLPEAKREAKKREICPPIAFGEVRG